MKTMFLPAGTEHIQFDELSHLLADALFPSTGDEDERMDYALTCIEYENELSAAVHAGALQVKHPKTHGPHPYPVGRALQDALVSVNDLRAYLIGRPIAVEIAPEQSPATPAPVVPLVPASDARPDPERRLALLRELGGAAKYARCEWTFTGIKALVTSEKAAGHKRSTEKTVRADLKEAAQNERDAKNAGFATGLGRR